MRWAFEGFDAGGQPVRGVTEVETAGTTDQAIDQLRRKGLFVTTIEPAGELSQGTTGGWGATAGTTGTTAGRARVPRLKSKELVFFTRQMAMLLGSGSAVIASLAALRKQLQGPAAKALIEEVISNMEEGLPLTESLRRHPRTFDSSYCAAVAAGESSASLPQMFSRLAEQVYRARQIRNRVIAAMAYPALLLLLSVKILAAMSFFVIPRFKEMFDNLGVQLPMMTRILLIGSDWLRAWWYVPLGLTLGGVIAATALLRSPQGKLLISDALIACPLVGRVLSSLLQARFFQLFGMLVQARVPILEAIDLVRGLTPGRKFQELFEGMAKAVAGGGLLSAAMERCPLISPLTCQAVRTGEESGNIGQACNFVAAIMDEDNHELINTLTKVMEPIILMVMGFVVGTVAVSLFLPLFDLTSAVQ